jgi:energy-coupling factor transport system substrate-specific component
MTVMPSGWYMKNRSVKDITVIAAMTAVLEVSKTALNFLQNIELVSLLIILYTLYFGVRRTLITVYLFDGIETLIWGLGLWVISYLYVWPVLVLVTYLFRQVRSKWPFVLISSLFGLSFGALCSLTTLAVGGPAMALSWWIAGIPYDIVHCAGNFMICFLLFAPLSKAIVKIKSVFSI